VNLLGPAWAVTATLLAPALRLHLRLRVAAGKEMAERLAERRGHRAARPPGPLLWLHAASVGESLSLLPLLEALAARRAALHFLVTTGTVTSARLLPQRLSRALAARVTHRFVPLDVPGWAARFLDGWRPDAAVLVESELWPNLIGAATSRGIPLALVQGRMSARSCAWWSRAPGLARAILAPFRLVLAQTTLDAARFCALGAAAECWGNLKYAAPPLPADAAELARLRALLGERPLLLAASTHPGEDTAVIAAHRALAREIPGLLTAIVPRHPERGDAIAALAAGLPVARRSRAEDPGPATAIWLGDTLGELGLFYRLARAAFIGGSLVPHGGQNPLEPARLRCPILLGPHTHNFAEIVGRLYGAGGARAVADAGALAPAFAAVLSNAPHACAMAEAAARVADDAAGLPARMAAAIDALLPAATAGPTEWMETAR